MSAALTRRGVLCASGALTVSFAMGVKAAELGGPPTGQKSLPGALKETPSLDAWIKVAADGRVTVFTGKAELGQGIKTALLQIAAEQLDLDPAMLEIVSADTARTPNEGYTAGSHSMQDSGTAILHAAAQVRTLLVDAAAAQLGVAASQLTTAAGAIHAQDGRMLAYGPLAAGLSLHAEASPSDTLKDPQTYKVIGTPLPRRDIPAKVSGGAAYIQDMRIEGMLHARVVRQPSPDAVLLEVDAGRVEGMPGVVKVVRDGSYLAVVAKREWEAILALRTLSATATWREVATLPDQDTIAATVRSLPGRDIEVLRWTNAADPPVQRLKARYTRPYQMHGSIGPSCALAHLDGTTMTVWTHTQGVYPQRDALAELLRMPTSQVRCIHVEGSGCYGHNGADDVAADAALIARAMPGQVVRVQWMREQEHTNEPYGPAMVSEISASLSSDGKVVDWDYDVWSNSHNLRPSKGRGGLFVQNAAITDKLAVPPPAPIPMPEGGGERNSNPLYTFPNAHVVSHFLPAMPLRVSAMRSLGAYHNIFAIESFMDELALAANVDPVTFRLRHLQDRRAQDVIQTAAEKFGWFTFKRDDHRATGRGFAFDRYKNLGAYCAIAMELSVDRETGHIRVGRVVAAVDSGQAVNPDGIRNQIEGSIVQSASWTLYEQVRFDRRHILSSDWSGYPILRFPAVPEAIEVHIADRPGQPYLGTGEAGQGPTAAALANALHDAVGVRLRDLPLSASRVKTAIGV